MSFVMRPKALEKLARHYAGDTGVTIETDTTCTVPFTDLKHNRITLPGWVHPDDLGALLGATLHETGHVLHDRPHYKLAARSTSGQENGGNFAILANVLQDIRLDCHRFATVPAARHLYTKLYDRCANAGTDIPWDKNLEIDNARRNALLPLLQGMIMEATGFGHRNGPKLAKALKTHHVWVGALVIARSVIGTDTSLVPETMKLRALLDDWLDERRDRNGKTNSVNAKPEPGNSGPRPGKTRRSSGEASSDKRTAQREKLANPTDKERAEFEEKASAIDTAVADEQGKREKHAELSNGSGYYTPETPEEAANTREANEALQKAEGETLGASSKFSKQLPPQPRNCRSSRNSRTIDSIPLPPHVGPASLEQVFNNAPLKVVDSADIMAGWVRDGLKRFLETTEYDALGQEEYKINADTLADVFTDPDNVLVSQEFISKGFDTHVQFILDVSGSMSGGRANLLVTAMKAIRDSAKRLNTARVTTSATWFSSGAASTKIEDLDRASWELDFDHKRCTFNQEWVRKLDREYEDGMKAWQSSPNQDRNAYEDVTSRFFQPWNGTRADLGVREAMRTLENVDASRRVVIFMTDGAVGGAGWKKLRELEAMPDVIVATLGLGTRRNGGWCGDEEDIAKIKYHVDQPDDLLLKLSEMLDEGGDRE